MSTGAEETTPALAPEGASSSTLDYPKIIADIDERSTSMGTIYQETLPKIEESEIEELYNQVEPLATQVASIIEPVIKHFKELKEKEDSNPDQIKEAKPLAADIDAALQRYKAALGDFSKTTGETLGKHYKTMNPHASPEEIQDIQEGDEPWFFSNPGFEQRSDEWHAARKDYIVRYKELKKVEQRTKETKPWFEAVTAVKTYGDEPLDKKKGGKKKPEKKAEKKPEKKVEKKAEKKKEDGGDPEKPKKKANLFTRIKMLVSGKGKA
ncbi:hypothetical protein H072_7085 [Dactylellina haptotyla CBS 200.50]|uniref:Uncharacterized protein n=1 Tax=Dactylellina haptotyla (strain CBS 200.50) TaxID=1284197 RepID=S8BV00_DACHA|nr:hypothetical protein H072_7085 [Dactylellina haptotyla CBS 200.50]